MKTHEIRTCPACRHTDGVRFPYGPTALRRCAACSLVYSAEYTDPTEIYVDGYLTENSEWGLDVMGPLFQDYLRHCAEIRLRRIEKVVRPGRLLDVGCGTGEVMLVARERGWAVQGVDPVSDSVEFAVAERGLDIRHAFLEDSDLPERSYDVVSAFHVVEHLQDAVGFLQLLSRWAKPGGHVVVEVPNWRSFHRRAFGEAWPHLRPNEHLAHYTTATLRGAIERAGLEPVRISTPGFVWSGQTLDQQLLDLGLHRYRRWARPVGRPGSTANRAAVWAVQSVYERTNTGMVILAIARVP